MTDPIRTVLVEDHEGFREGIKHILTSDPRFVVVGTAGCAMDGAALADSLKPHLMVMDIRLPDLSGIRLTRRIVEKHPDTRVVMLSMFTSEEYVLESFRAGAVGYLVKHSDASNFCDDLYMAAQGNWVVDRSLNAFAHFPRPDTINGSQRIYRQTLDGVSNKSAAPRRKSGKGRSKMSQFTEKRKQNRWQFEAPIVYSKFHSGIDHSTRSYNFSDTGLCLKMESPIPMGTPVFVRVENGHASVVAKKAGDACPRTVGLAEVRWCRKVENDGELFYQVGMKYLHPGY
jgi:DNA-binding NarL/FixJ family response regulator